MPIANVGLRFSSGKTVGSWDIPSPQSRPVEFNEVAKDIGFHITLGISQGEEGCFFVSMNNSCLNGDSDV